jgi:hypothetical protein
VFQVPRSIAFQFGQPEVTSTLRQSGELTGWIWMTMPETSMDENDLAAAYKHQIWGSRKIAAVKPVPISHSMHQAANPHLGTCVFVSYAAHPLASLGWCQSISHILASSTGPCFAYIDALM